MSDRSQFSTAGDSANPAGALNTHGQTGSDANSADTLGPANMEAVAKHVGAIQQEADRPAVENLTVLSDEHVLCADCGERCDCGESDPDKCSYCSLCWEAHADDCVVDGCQLCLYTAEESTDEHP